MLFIESFVNIVAVTFPEFSFRIHNKTLHNDKGDI